MTNTNSGRWELIQTIFDDALAFDGAARDDYIERNAAGDLVVFNEVQTLVTAYESDPNGFEDPVIDLAVSALLKSERASLEGETILHYRIVRRLGGGGMGEVYLAEDRKLHRFVALKFLAPDLAGDARARRHLKKEAELSGAFEHPNICKVYDFEETKSHSFIVMQFLEGEPLSKIVDDNRLESYSVDRIAEQTIAAIAAAHEVETIHRDIKPGNVMVAQTGEVHVLDFGLAKIIHDGRPPQNARDYVTNATQTGLILGTVAYMSPEQLKGEKLDYRTDVFSLGTLVCELYAGANPFVRDSDAETMAAVLKGIESVPASALSALPPKIRRIVQKSLAAERDGRYPSAVHMLEDLHADISFTEPNRISLALKVVGSIAIFAGLMLMLYLYSQWKPATGVAVLPFANETADPSLDYLADGLPENLGAKLNMVKGFRNVPFSKLSGLNSLGTMASDIGQQFRADLVLMGRVFKQNGEVWVESKVVESSDGDVLRSASRRLDLENIPAAEDEILNEMFSGTELPAFTVAAVSARNERGGTESSEALRQYFVGRHYWRKRDRENIPKAIDAFQKAIDLDPGFGKAYAGLADSYLLLNSVAYGSMPAKEAYTKARSAAKQALEVDPLDAKAHTSLGVVLMKQDSNWAESERYLRRAIEIDEDEPSARYWLSGLLAQTARAEESIIQAEKAKELDPFSPLVECNLARTYYFARQFDRSLNVLSQQLTSDPNDVKAQYLKGLNLLQKGEKAEALAIFHQISSQNKMLGIAAEGFTLAKLGRRSDALKLVGELENEAVNKYIPPQEFAFIYIGLGEKEKAFEFLNRAADERSNSLSALRVEPLFDPIRDDARFADLLRKLSLDRF